MRIAEPVPTAVSYGLPRTFPGLPTAGPAPPPSSGPATPSGPMPLSVALGQVVHAAVFVDRDQAVAAGLADGTIVLVRVDSMRADADLVGHGGAVVRLAAAPNGRFASASHDGTVRLWDVQKAHCAVTIRGKHPRAESLAFNADGTLLASGWGNGAIWIADATSGKPRVQAQADEAVLAVAFAPDGCRLASASWDRTVRLWNPITHHASRRLRGHADSVNDVAFSRDGCLLVTASYDHTVRLWPVRTSRALRG